MIMPSTPTGSAGTFETTVPLSALAISGINPDAGDSVSFSAEGTVTRIDGDRAHVRIEKINDEVIAEAASVPDEEGEMQRLAQEADRETY